MSELILNSPQQSDLSVFSVSGFEPAQRIAKALSASSLVPNDYRGNVSNCLIALEISHRVGASALMVMQNLYVVHGRPSWSSQWITAALNSTRRFSPIRFKMRDLGKKEVEYAYTRYEGYGQDRTKKRETGVQKLDPDRECIAWAKELSTGEILEGPAVTLEMAVLEGWYNRSDSKWRTMGDLMLRYRAVTFFGRLYAPEVLMGMMERAEAEDAAASEPEILPANARLVDDLSSPATPTATTAPAEPLPAKLDVKKRGGEKKVAPDGKLDPRKDALEALAAWLETFGLTEVGFIEEAGRAGLSTEGSFEESSTEQLRAMADKAEMLCNAIAKGGK